MSNKKKDSVVKSAVYFASGTLVSRILGLFRDAIVVAIFGKTISDAWLAAFRFPNLFRRLFGEGAFSACFVPSYVEFKEKHDEVSRGQLTSGVFTLLCLILIPFSLFMILGMDKFISLWVQGDGFTEIPGKIEQTVLMAKIMFPFLVLMSFFAFVMALLNSHKIFLITSIAPSLLNISIIVSCIWCYQTNNLSGEYLAWAVVIGGVLQLAILLPMLRGLSIPFQWSISNIYSAPVKQVLRTFIPSLFGLGIVQFMALVNVSFASYLQEGTVTYVYLADRLLEFPLSMISVSLGTALLPTLSEQIHRHTNLQFKAEVIKNLNILLFLCIPSGVGLWMLSPLMTDVLFQRGAFQPEQAVIVAQITKIYAFTLVGASMARIMSQVFYAGKDTKTPAIASLLGLVFHLILAPILMKFWGVYGLVASTCFASFINTMHLFFIFHRRHGSLAYGKLFLFIIKCLLASCSIVAVCYGVQLIFASLDWHYKVRNIIDLSQIVQMLLALVLSVISYFIACSFLNMRESSQVLNKFSRRLFKVKK